MNKLPHDILCKIGSILPDNKSRSNCLNASKCFESICYELNNHTIKFFQKNYDDKLNNLSRITEYLRKIKPLLNQIVFYFDQIDRMPLISFEETLWVPDQSSVVLFWCDNIHDILKPFLSISTKLALVVIRMEDVQEINQNDVDMLLLLKTPLGLGLNIKSLDILNNKELATHIKYLDLNLNDSMYRYSMLENHAQKIKLSNLDDAVPVTIATMDANIQISKKFYLVRELTTTYFVHSNNLYKSIRNARRPLRLEKMTIGYIKNEEEELYEILALLPKTCVIGFTICKYEPFFIKVMQKIEKDFGMRTHAYFTNMETYLISKVVKKFVPNVGVFPFEYPNKFFMYTAQYEPPRNLIDLCDMEEVYDLLSNDLKNVWFWILGLK